MSQML